MPRPSDPPKASSEISTPWLSAHGHFAAQDLLVIFAANRDHGDVASDPGDDLQGLFDRVVVRFVDRIDQVVALDVVARAVEFNLVFRSVRHSSCAN